MQSPRRLVFDIETAGELPETFDEVSRQLLEAHWRRYAKTEEEYEEAKGRLTFSPLTSTIVAIGMLDADSKKGAAYFVRKDGIQESFEEEGIKFESGTEAAMLQKFWRAAVQFEEFITFNGRMFDVPFLMVRSAIHGIRPSKNLMVNRYLESQPFNLKHIDLQDQLGFYGATRFERLGLHFWCRAFGVPSPKLSGTSGSDITTLFHQGKFLVIARYCMNDVRATLALYEYWEQYLKFS